MADTKYIKGGDLMLFQKSGSGYTAFAYAKSHSLQLDADHLKFLQKIRENGNNSLLQNYHIQLMQSICLQKQTIIH